MVKLILSDIDDTIKPIDEKEIPQEAIDAFRCAMEADIIIGPASGRGYAWVQDFFGKNQDCCQTALATNGSEIYLKGEKLYESSLSHEGLKHLQKYLKGVAGSGLIVFDGGTPLLLEGTLEDLAASFPAYAKTCIKIDTLPSFNIVKANVFFNPVATHQAELPGKTRALVEDLNEHFEGFDFDYPRPGFSNIMPRAWNKGAAVRYLADAIGAGLDEVVIFGDAGNDIPMFEAVEHSVAVANATPEASAAARWHIGSCDEGAAAKAICALARGDWPFGS